MDKSEISFKYRTGSTSVEIPVDKVKLGEYYANTGSSFLYLRSNADANESLLFPGVLFDKVDDTDQTDDGLKTSDTYNATIDKRYLVFEKYGAKSGRFIPGAASSICIVHADLAEIRNNAIKVKVDPPHVLRATNELAKGSSNAPVFAVIGYTDDSYKNKNQFGSSSMVRLSDIDNDGYATVSYTVSGYLLMKNAPTADDIINHGVTGMSWHVEDKEISLTDGTSRYGTARLTKASDTEYIIEVYTPYMSACNRSVLKINTVDDSKRLIIENDATDRHSMCNIKTDTKLSVNEALTFALNYMPAVYGQEATYKNGGKHTFHTIATNGSFDIGLKKSDLTNGIVNCLLQSGLHIMTPNAEDDSQRVTLKVNRTSLAFLKSAAPILCGLELKIQPCNLEMPVWIIDTDNYAYVPISFIHGSIFGDGLAIGTSNEDLHRNWTITLENDILSEMNASSEFYHIHNIYATHRQTLLGGDSSWEQKNGSDASQPYNDEPVFLMIDYQAMTLNDVGRSQYDTAPVRKYIRLNSNESRATFTTPQGNLVIDIQRS